MSAWEHTVKSVKESLEAIKNRRPSKLYPSYIDKQTARLLQIWLDGREIKNNPDSDNLLEK